MKLLKLTAKTLLGVYCAALLGLSLFQRDLQRMGAGPTDTSTDNLERHAVSPRS